MNAPGVLRRPDIQERRRLDPTERAALEAARAGGMPAKVAARQFDVTVHQAHAAGTATKTHVDLGPSLLRRLDALARARGVTGKELARAVINGALRRELVDYLMGSAK